MHSRITHIAQDSFWRHNAVFLAGSLLVAGVNYLYYPVTGRLLPVESFGEVQVAFTIFGLFSIMLIAVQAAAISITANTPTQRAKKTVAQFELVCLRVGILFGLFLALSSPLLSSWLKFDNPTPFILIGIALIISVFLNFRTAVLQGTKHFFQVSLAGLIASFGKLLFGSFFIGVGFSSFGALTGFILAQLLALLYAIHASGIGNNLLQQIVRALVTPFSQIFRTHRRYIISFVAASSLVTFLYTADTIVVKLLFDPATAGEYAGVAAIAKIVFFATASITGVLLASVGKSYRAAESRQRLLRSLALIGIIGGSCLVIFGLFPNQVIQLLIGEKYLPFAQYLPLLALTVFIVSMLNLFTNYQLAHHRYQIVWNLLTGALVVVIGLILFHNSIEGVVICFLVGSSTSLICFVVSTFLLRRRDGTEEETPYINYRSDI